MRWQCSPTARLSQRDGLEPVFANWDFAIARLNPDGSLDTSFGTGGIQKTPIWIDGADAARAVVVQSDGKIVAVGSLTVDASQKHDFGIIRLNSDGSYDTTFNPTGTVPGTAYYHFGEGEDHAQGVIIEPDGKYVVAGRAFKGTHYDFGLVRFTTTGLVDTTFGTNGSVTTDFGNNGPPGGFNTAEESAYGIVRQSDGKLVVAGYAYIDGIDFALARYDANGNLDTTFGTNGKVTTSNVGYDLNSSATDFGLAMTIQPDDKVIVVGTSQDNFAMARYNPNGSLDTTFSYDGKVDTDFGTIDSAYAVAVDAMGKIYVAGTGACSSCDPTETKDFALARYNSDGSLDATFSSDGKTTADFFHDDFAYAVTIQADSKVVIAGSTKPDASFTTANFAMARFDASILPTPNAPSSLSATAASSSQINLSWQDNSTNETGFKIEQKIGAAGTYYEITTAGMNITNYADNGLSANTEYCYRVRATNSGEHSSYSNESCATTFVSVTSPGDLDPSFGTGGTMSIDANAPGARLNRIYALAQQPDGKIIAGGTAYQTSGAGARTEFIIGRFFPNGALDTTFGYNGFQAANVFLNTGGDEVRAVAVQDDGKIVAVGPAWNGSINRSDFGIVRLNTDGSFDVSFGNNNGQSFYDFGWILPPGSGGDDNAYGFVIQPDGKFVIAGSAWNGNNTDFGLVRLTPTGAADLTFGTSGAIFTDFGSSDVARAIVQQPDGKLILAGYAHNGSDNDFALARYDANGNLDTSFGNGGKVTTEISGQDGAYAMALQADGKIILAGQTGVAGDFALVRYNPNGTLDTSFGTGGKIITDLGGSATAFAVAVQSGGKIVAAGRGPCLTNCEQINFVNPPGGSTTDTSEFVLVRYNASNGSLDSSFSSDGKVYTDIRIKDQANAILINSFDGSILLGGSAEYAPPVGPLASWDIFAMARYDGSNQTDTAPPNAPTNLQATAMGSTQINLSWQDNSTNETEFRIERKTGAGGTYAQIATVGANVTTYPNTGLSSSTLYCYRVFATNVYGDSSPSNERCLSTGSVLFVIERATGSVRTDGSYNCGLGTPGPVNPPAAPCFNSGTGADLAEAIDVSESVEPGDLVEPDPNQPKHYRKARPNSTIASVVISSKPGMTMALKSGQAPLALPIGTALVLSAFSLHTFYMDACSVFRTNTHACPYGSMSVGALAEGKTEESSVSIRQLLQETAYRAQIETRPLLALVGRVPVNASTENGPIRAGDLLIASATKPGYAMRCIEAKRCEGAVIGKALEALEKGEGIVLILLMR
jgi:uncharacterized delta-60 repeat protein